MGNKKGLPDFRDSPCGTVFMVGDSCSDVRAARGAGVKSIAVSWGHQSLGRLAESMPDLIIRTPQELMDAVRRSW